VTAVALPAPRFRGRPAWRILASLLALAALVWGTFSVVNVLAHGERHVARAFPAAGVTTVDVSTDRGTVRVVASDRDDISVRGYISNGLGGTDHSERVRGDRLVLDASCSVPVAYWCTASYTVRVPRDVEVRLWSGSGDVSVSGTTKAAVLGSQHGSIDASNLGGDVVRARTDHGSVRLSFATTPRRVDATTSHGDVTVVVPRSDAEYRVELATDHGSTTNRVRSNPDAPAVLHLSTGHGDATARYDRGS
jgi:hypothetical protein